MKLTNLRNSVHSTGRKDRRSERTTCPKVEEEGALKVGLTVKDERVYGSDLIDVERGQQLEQIRVSDTRYPLVAPHLERHRGQSRPGRSGSAVEEMEVNVATSGVTVTSNDAVSNRPSVTTAKHLVQVAVLTPYRLRRLVWRS